MGALEDNETEDHLSLFKRIISRKFMFKPTVHKEAKNLIKRLLKFEKKRIGRERIAKHEYWFINGKFEWNDVVQKRGLFSEVPYKPAVSQKGDHSNFKVYEDQTESPEKATSVQLAMFRDF